MNVQKNSYEQSPAQRQPTAAPKHQNIRKSHKEPKTTVNGEKLEQTLALVMVKPPPSTNTFPVEKTMNQKQVKIKPKDQ
jgi:hypothetical protein